MTAGSSGSDGSRVSFFCLLPFLLIAFGLTWGILALFLFLPAQMTGMVGELTGQHPLFYLAVYAPAIAAFVVVTYSGGVEGLRRYLVRIAYWRCPLSWYAFLLIGIPLLFLAGAALKGNLLADPFPFASLQSFSVALVLTAIKGPVEEFGWRGLALPLLQRKFAPIWAGLILGFVWGFWHLPAFLLSGTPQSAWAFTPFLTGTVAISVLMTALFNASRGSILLPAFFHFQLINPLWPDAQPYDSFLFLLAAAVALWSNRQAMFGKEGAVREVIP